MGEGLCDRNHFGEKLRYDKRLIKLSSKQAYYSPQDLNNGSCRIVEGMHNQT